MRNANSEGQKQDVVYCRKGGRARVHLEIQTRHEKHEGFLLPLRDEAKGAAIIKRHENKEIDRVD
jgi:hypothetical protein